MNDWGREEVKEDVCGVCLQLIERHNEDRRTKRQILKVLIHKRVSGTYI